MSLDKQLDSLWRCTSSTMEACMQFVGMTRWQLPLRRTGSSSSGSSVSQQTVDLARPCCSCSVRTLELTKGARGELLCRECLRKEDEALLEPITDEERRGLDLLAGVLDAVPWSYWKPGEQPAMLLDWLFLGDLEEAVNFDLLRNRGIGAVVNLINWWELTARLPEVADIDSLYSSQGVRFLEADSEDRLFFDIVEKSWPEVEAFMEKCHSEGLRVLVNCKAGHNRSACCCVCWLMVRENMSLLEAVEWVLLRRGTILSNHGFRLQLVRLALKLDRLGVPSDSGAVAAIASTSINGGATNGAAAAAAPAAAPVDPEDGRPSLGSIIQRKRLSAKYDMNSKVFSTNGGAASRISLARGKSLICSGDAVEYLSQRTLKMDLLACLYHRGENFRSRYQFTSDPPKVIGSGFSGDVVLCKMRERTAVCQNSETGVRCVKTFSIPGMGPDRLEKLKNECEIYLSLEHPHIARLFDVFEDDKEVSLVMQYCSGGTLEDAIRTRGAYSEAAFQQVAVEMLLAVNYIHQIGIVHRDIKPRNWVYEADGQTAKLIDFGFSTKALAVDSGVIGCMGTLGYLAPEVVRAGLSEDAAYTEKCDIWSLGVVFYELLAGMPAFHREAGECDGYTEEVVLREIEEVTEDGIRDLLKGIGTPRPLMTKMLTKDVTLRPSADLCLQDDFLVSAREALRKPEEHLSVGTVLARFRAHSKASKTTRAWLLAVARSPTHLPWKDFKTLRNTFKMFDARNMTGTVSLDTFLSVVLESLCRGASPRDAAGEQAMEMEVRQIWKCICGEQDSLSYCEFMAMLLPPVEDVFEDVTDSATCAPSPMGSVPEDVAFGGASMPASSSSSSLRGMASGRQVTPTDMIWDPSLPVSSFLPLLRTRRNQQIPIFSSTSTVREVVEGMSKGHHRWAIVKYKDGRQAFFDYMDINHQLLSTSARSGSSPCDAMAQIVSMPVGELANCSGHCPYVPIRSGTPLRYLLRIIATGKRRPGESAGPSPMNGDGHPCVGSGGDPIAPRRVPIVSETGEVIYVWSCLDFLDVALRFAQPAAVLKSMSARTFDRRKTVIEESVQCDAALMDALRNMHSTRHTVCPATLRELSGGFGGLVTSNVVSVSDLKLIISEERYEILEMSVNDFIAWRQNVLNSSVDSMLRTQRLQRFNVVSVDAGDSLHTLAHRLLASKLQRIFLSSDEIARIVGIVSSRDILVEVLDQLL